MELNEKLEIMRIQFGLSRKQLADYLEIPESNLAGVEQGDCPITTHQLGRLAVLYGRDFSELQSTDAVDFLPGLSPRLSELSTEALRTLARVNQIAVNLRELDMLLGPVDDEE
jgi:transcriptional regulator with XRE-family HTH domain